MGFTSHMSFFTEWSVVSSAAWIRVRICVGCVLGRQCKELRLDWFFRPQALVLLKPTPPTDIYYTAGSEQMSEEGRESVRAREVVLSLTACSVSRQKSSHLSIQLHYHCKCVSAHVHACVVKVFVCMRLHILPVCPPPLV